MSTLLISFIATAVTAQSKEEKAAIEQVKKRIVKLGTGPEAKAQVKLRDKTKLKGYVSKTEVESFVITDAKTNAETTVTDANVTELTTRMPRGAVVVISALAAVGECFSLAHSSLRRAENCNAVTIITF
ncbi:MAG: hypothetical protein JST84_19700 [Acidobacteria bacterium]|nr:hypothetical protein [Acidobacteriota bacterium]